MTTVQSVTVTMEDSGLRLDRWFRRHHPALKHGRLEKLLRTGEVRVDGRRASAGLRLEAGQMVRVPPGVILSAGSADETGMDGKSVPDARETAALRARVLYRDEHLLVLDKPAGLPVQGGSGTVRHLDAMLDALRFEAPERPRLVHRLDKDTSGVLLLARTAAAAATLAGAFRSRTVRKTYWAVVTGVPEPATGRLSIPLAKGPSRQGERVMADADDGKEAVTDYRVMGQAGQRVAWLELEPRTGRTHQLRAHCALLGTPVLGDGKYGGAAAFLPGGEIARQLHLHARTLVLPTTKGGGRCFTAPLPSHMAATFAFFGFYVA
ncbi:MAG: 23S rRNA pseudouridine synthase [Rhodospirillaceae bacterium]|nr:MAG: 23S rRNA pseudouridine synthase [Rhodospirillaceae bacterium]